MSVWCRNGVWYYQFRYKNQQYSGRAGEAVTQSEARDFEKDRKERVTSAVDRAVLDEASREPTGQEAEKNEGKVNIYVDESLLKQLLEGATMPRAREEEITTKEQFTINWKFIIAVAAGVFIAKVLYGLTSNLVTSLTPLQ